MRFKLKQPKFNVSAEMAGSHRIGLLGTEEDKISEHWL